MSASEDVPIALGLSRCDEGLRWNASGLHPFRNEAVGNFLSDEKRQVVAMAHPFDFRTAFELGIQPTDRR